MSYDQAAFERNYQHLMKNMSGAWFSGVFSKGDEEKMREALMEVAKMPEGRELISQLPPNFKIGSTNWIFNKGVGGQYEFGNNYIELNTSSIQGITPTVLFHELRHAVQDTQKIDIANKGYSAEEAMCIGKLVEAETAAWERVMYASTKNSQWETNKVDPNDAKLYNSCLKQCNGNAEKARKMMVGKLIPEYMSKEGGWDEGNWRFAYDMQAYHNTVEMSKDGHITAQGNKKEFDKILDHYAKKYGIDKSKISKANICEDVQITAREQGMDKTLASNTSGNTYCSQVQAPVLPKRYTNENNVRKDLSQSLGGLSNKEWQNIRKSMDTNNDGKLDTNEIWQIYNSLDVNHDGKITKADIKSAGGRNEIMDQFLSTTIDKGR